MDDKIKREDSDKKVILTNVMMEENKIQSEMTLGNIPRFIYSGVLFLKLKKKKTLLNSILNALN